MLSTRPSGSSAAARPSSLPRRILKAIFGPLKRKCETGVFWIRRRILIAVDLDRPLDVRPKLPVQFRRGTPGDIDRLTLTEHGCTDADREAARRRLAAGDWFIVAVHEGQLVFYVWLMFGQLDLYSERYIPMSPDRVYAYNGFTVRSHRGFNILPGFYTEYREILRRQGCREVLGHILSTNRASLRAHGHVAYRREGSFWEIRVGRRLHYFVPRRLREWIRTPKQPAASTGA